MHWDNNEMTTMMIGKPIFKTSRFKYKLCTNMKNNLFIEQYHLLSLQCLISDNLRCWFPAKQSKLSSSDQFYPDRRLEAARSSCLRVIWVGFAQLSSMPAGLSLWEVALLHFLFSRQWWQSLSCSETNQVIRRRFPNGIHQEDKRRRS